MSSATRRARIPRSPPSGAVFRLKLLDVQRSVVEQLKERDALARGLDVGTATDVLWTLNHPTVWHLLVRERGWTAEQYERWLGEPFARSSYEQGTTRRPAPHRLGRGRARLQHSPRDVSLFWAPLSSCCGAITSHAQWSRPRAARGVGIGGCDLAQERPDLRPPVPSASRMSTMPSTVPDRQNRRGLDRRR